MGHLGGTANGYETTPPVIILTIEYINVVKLKINYLTLRKCTHIIMSFLSRKNYESGESDAYYRALRQELRRQPAPQNEDCLDVEHRENEAGGTV